MITTPMIHDKSVTSAALEDLENEIGPSFHKTYHELSEKHVVEVDALVQLKTNMAQLEDLHARLKFMMGELSYLLKKS